MDYMSGVQTRLSDFHFIYLYTFCPGAGVLTAWFLQGRDEAGRGWVPARASPGVSGQRVPVLQWMTGTRLRVMSAMTIFLICEVTVPTLSLGIEILEWIPDLPEGFLALFFFQVFIEFITILLLFYALVFWPQVCGILAPRPGIELASPMLEGEVLTTGPPGKSPS
ncbi:unnamed protein product [Rangifer tarandus platyrhynchus]|uniref:Uncharacterized protein n=2 Tax=Rangifer tarandus platyrhynchus TaxID=3082113 RepID=A0AC59YNQ5_RANTA|nr:unnamed protein product [Rangifer tarandus platyrhynchus]